MTADERGRRLTEAIIGTVARRDAHVRVGELELHAVVWGDPAAPPVLLVHGNGAHAHWWDPLVPGLCRTRRAIAVDLRGHGRSERPERVAYGLPDQTADLVGILDALEPGPLPVVAHSMGGRVALWLATHHPERVTSLTVLDTQLSALPDEVTASFREKVRDRRSGGAYPDLDSALAAYRLVPEEPEIPPHVLENVAFHAICERAPGDWRVRFDRAVLLGDGGGALWDELARVRCPVRAAYAAARGPIDGEVRELVRRQPQIEVRRFPGAHHFFLSHPEPVVEWLLEAL